MSANGPALVRPQEQALDLPLLKATICPDLSDSEFRLFAEVCKRSGLDPFRKQLYAIKRGGKVSHQTGIDGFRVIAQRSGEYEGQSGPFWCGKEGVWTDVWLDKAPPVASKVGVYRKGFREPVWGVARTEAYNAGQGLWTKMPDVMIAKCAEALALRKAFPEDLSGLDTSEEMDQAADRPGPSRGGPPSALSANEESERIAAFEATISIARTKADLTGIAGRIKAAGLSDAARLGLSKVWAAKLAAVKAPKQEVTEDGEIVPDPVDPEEDGR